VIAPWGTNRTAACLGVLLGSTLLGACGSAVSTPVSGSATPPPATAAPSTPAATQPATPTATPSAAPAATPSGTTLTIGDYSVALTLPPSVSDAIYSIDTSGWGPGPTSPVDANGTPYTILPPVNLWTTNLTTDPACSNVATQGLVTIAVFETDPTNLAIGDGPTDIKHIGQYWFGVYRPQAELCTDGNPDEATSVAGLLQAYDTIHAA